MMNDFNAVFDTLSEKLKIDCVLTETSLYFSSLSNDLDKIRFSLSILEDADLLPDLDYSTCGKSCTESVKFRNAGNRAFLKKDDMIALQFYTQSAAFAPEESQELALAFANRSAVSFSLQHFNDCITDIDRALGGQYPKHLMYKLYERKGKCLLSTGKLANAEETFNKALNSINESNLSENKISSFISALTKELNLIKLTSCSLNQQDITDTVRCANNDNLALWHSSDVPNKSEIPKLSYPENNNLIGACDAIRIDYNKAMGRHIVACRDIKPGDVLTIERPYASILIPSAYNLYCFNCLQRCHTLLPCRECPKVLFCNEICRSSCMESSHLIECSVLESLIDLGCSKLELLAVRTLLVTLKNNRLHSLKKFVTSIEEKYREGVCDETLKGFDENNEYRSNNYETVHCLATNSALRSNADLFRRSCLACCILHCLDNLSNFFTNNYACEESHDFISVHDEDDSDYKCLVGSLLLKYLQIMPCNAHEVSEMCLMDDDKYVDDNDDDNGKNLFSYDSKEIGGGLYPLLSLINHSCDPNVVRHSHHGDTVVLRAIQSITAGEQILDNYGYHHAVHDRETRQASLLSQYHFTCKCIACLEDWPLYHYLPEEEEIVFTTPSVKDQVEASSKEFKDILKFILKGEYTIENLNKLLNHLTLLQSSTLRPLMQYSLCQEAAKIIMSMFANHYVCKNNRDSKDLDK